MLNLLSHGHLRAKRQKVLFGAILSLYIFSAVRWALDVSSLWINQHAVADALAAQDLSAGNNGFVSILIAITNTTVVFSVHEHFILPPFDKILTR